ncbi:MAG TPA: alpha/beta fold hydrolase, partial [Flavobacteriales bacterium]|nr:alpha/beta fold hydrolase [Flavobacteriales bacterium]
MAIQRPEAVAAAARGMAIRPDRTTLLLHIAKPTLILTGDADTLMPLPTSQAMAEAIPGSRLVVVPGAAHLSNLENASFFNAALGEFLAEL